MLKLSSKSLLSNVSQDSGQDQMHLSEEGCRVSFSKLSQSVNCKRQCSSRTSVSFSERTPDPIKEPTSRVQATAQSEEEIVRLQGSIIGDSFDVTAKEKPIEMACS